MKKILLPLALSLVLASCSLFETKENAAAESTLEIPKKRLLVLRILNKSLFGGEDLGKHASEYVRTNLSNFPDFVLVQEEAIPERAKFISEFQTYNLDTIFQSARGFGISGVVLGSIDELSTRESGDEVGVFRTRYRKSNAKITLMLYDVASERVILTTDGKGDVKEEFTEFLERKPTSGFDPIRGKVAVEKAFDVALKAVPSHLHLIDWSGKIAKVDPPRFYINAGKAAGVRVGQFLKVFGPDQPIFEPATKKLMGMASGKYKGTIEIIDYFGTDGAIAVAHTGAGFVEGDRVEVHARRK